MKLLRVGITHGDINGISLEMITKALGSPEMLEICTPVVFSNDACFFEAAKLVEIEQPVPLEVIQSTKNVLDGRVNLVNVCQGKPQIEWGQQTEIALKAEADSLNAAIDACKAGLIDILICAPGRLDNDIDSHSLSDFIKQASGSDSKEFDWIQNGKVRTLKMHPLEYSTELGEGLAMEAFINDITAINDQLREDICTLKPRIAIVSPDQKLASAIKELQEKGVIVFGPFDAKDFIETGKYSHYDAVLFSEEEDARHKLIEGLDSSVTIGYVSGLTIVLAYPLTGVCYEKAGKNQAEETTLRNAIYEAIDIHRNRESFRRASRNPLEKQWNPKGRDDFKLDLTKDEG